MSKKIIGKIGILSRKAGICAAFLKAVVSGQVKPFAIGWCITNRCNSKCVYCHSWKNAGPELSTDQAKEIMLLLSSRGTRVIRFTGGEPLLRDDLPELLALSKSLGIWTVVATNGILVPLKIRELKGVDSVSISIDGPEHVHDVLRGAGSYQKAVEACVVLSRENIPVSISTVLTSLNSDSIEHVLELASRFRAKAHFQPATEVILRGDTPNAFLLEDADRSRVLGRLLDLKKKGGRVGNSGEALKYLLGRPRREIRDCVAGKLFFRIEAEGDMRACPRSGRPAERLNILRQGLDHCLKSVGSRSCDHCRSAAMIEMNLLAGLNWGSVVNGIRKFF